MTTPVIGTTTPTPAPTQSQNAAQELSGNFDTFLTLLTTQLKNQDPLSPMDSNQFTQQLVEFSGVEQQINTNANLETLIGQGKSAAGASAVSYLGKTVTLTNGNAALNGGAANWNYTLGGAAQSTMLTVTDSSGRAVYAGQGELAAGTHTFTWNGLDNAGNQLPDGTYKLTVGAIDVNGQAVTSTVSSQGTVTEVDLTGDEPMLMVGAMSVPLSQATMISGGTSDVSAAMSSLAAPITNPLNEVSSLLSSL